MDRSDVPDQRGFTSKFAYEFASNPSAFEPGWSKTLIFRAWFIDILFFVVVIAETYS